MSLGGNARARFLCDAERCIECNACVTACKNENEVPWGINRRRVVTINDGSPGERSISVACMHCSDAPCMAVCPVDCFYQTESEWNQSCLARLPAACRWCLSPCESSSVGRRGRLQGPGSSPAGV
jgi:Fe-S-cluster-containing dehydrogenase component